MAHKEQRDFVEKVKSNNLDYFSNKKVLEVGSLNINGTLRDFFTNCDYTGIDVGEGPGVDIVCSGESFDAPDESYDVVCSGECFEHNPNWLETFKNMIRMCKDEGLVFFTCASEGRAEHGTTRTDIGSSPFTAEWNYYRNLNEIDFTSKINFDSIFDTYQFEYNPYSFDLYFFGVKKKTKKIVDCFPFFNEKELLELRINLLKDHVDAFIISELNYTHSGNKKEFSCKKLIEELDLPKEKIKVIELEIGSDEDLEIEESDLIFSKASESNMPKNWTRERLQRDCILQEINNYSDDTVFILSDCDEIIDPKILSYFSECCRNNQQYTIKVPLVSLEGRADKRLYDGDNPVPWSNSLVLCTKKQLSNGGTPTKFRGGYNNPYPTVWITENGEMIQDCGWHFTWMGDESRRKLKSESIIHADNLSVYDNLSSDSMQAISGSSNEYRLKDYSRELLPKIIFELPRVKEFLLGKEEKTNTFTFYSNPKPTVWIVDNFYDNPDEIREFALKQSYVEGGFGRGFIGRRTEQQFLWPGLKEAFENVIGQKITEWESHTMNGRFQSSYAGEPLVWHCDSQRWGGMLYLTPNAPYQCGTTLYANKKNRARSYHDPGWDVAWTNIPGPGGAHLDGTHFEPVDVMGNVYNRLAIFDASCIHSASEYFGTSMETSRLWQMFFFDT